MDIVTSTKIQDFVTVEDAFSQFQRFGRNENSKKITHMTRSMFQEALLKQDIDVIKGEDDMVLFKGWHMKKVVPILSNDTVEEGVAYVPPPVKRSRDW